MLRRFRLLRRGRDEVDGFAGDQIGKILVQGSDGRRAGRVLEPDDERVLHPARRVEVAIEAGDDFHRLLRAVGDLVKVQVVGGNQFIPQQMFADVLVPGFPIRAAGFVDQHEGHKLAFPGLHEGQRLVALIHRAKPAGEQRNSVAVPDEDEFAREEIAERHQLLVVGDDGIGALLPRQADVHAETVFQSRALVAGVHDARPRPGDDHEARRRHLLAKLQRLLVFRLARQRTRGTEDGYLALRGIGRKEAESIPQFPDRRLDDAHIALGRNILEQLEGVLDDVGDLGLIRATAFGLD